MIRRGDDSEEIVRLRIQKYKDETEPVLRSLVDVVDHYIEYRPSGTQDIDLEADGVVDRMRGEWIG